MTNSIKPDSNTPGTSWVKSAIFTTDSTPTSRNPGTLPPNRDSLQTNEEPVSILGALLTTGQKCWEIVWSLWTFSLSFFQKTKSKTPDPVSEAAAKKNLLLLEENDAADELFYDASDTEEDFVDAETGSEDWNSYFTETVTTQPSSANPSPHQGLLLEFISTFPETPVMTSEASSGQPLFGTYLMNHIFNNPASCNFNETTGEFTLSFSSERIIPIKQIPSNPSRKSVKALNNLKGKSLHIGRQVSGKIITENSEKRITFKEGSLSLKWKQFMIPLEASLLEIKPSSNDPATFGLKGKAPIVEGWQWISAQDFVNTLTLNSLS